MFSRNWFSLDDDNSILHWRHNTSSQIFQAWEDQEPSVGVHFVQVRPATNPHSAWQPSLSEAAGLRSWTILRVTFIHSCCMVASLGTRWPHVLLSLPLHQPPEGGGSLVTQRAGTQGHGCVCPGTRLLSWGCILDKDPLFPGGCRKTPGPYVALFAAKVGEGYGTT